MTDQHKTDQHKEDARHVLDEDIFDYRTSKDGKVFISWQGKQVMILKGESARAFLAKVEGREQHEAQLVMAKITGNFKRGNERLAKEKKK